MPTQALQDAGGGSCRLIGKAALFGLASWNRMRYHAGMASGQTRVRLPVELHEALVVEAERQGVSLNTLIVALLAGGIGWKRATS